MKRIVDYEGRKVEAVEVAFEAQPENWNYYKLEDGSVIKVKTVMLEVFRLNEHKPNGEPVYQFAAQQLVAVQVPEELKKKG